MRKGSNPQKKDFKVAKIKNHHVVMVLFVPELKGYYENLFEVFKLSIQSLYLTLPLTSSITIVDNNSCKEVKDFLIRLHKDNKIHGLQLLNENIGKIDALIGAARSLREDYITLSDCDILFRQGWVNATFDIFSKIGKTASVSPIPTRGLSYYTFSLQKDILFKKIKLRFKSFPLNHKDYNLFLNSINWDISDNKDCKWPVIYKGEYDVAIMGSDHQVLTLKRSILFKNSPKEPSYIKVGNLSEENYIDFPIDVSGGYRLSTLKFYAQHMGNKPEAWMYKELEKLKSNQEVIDLSHLKEDYYDKQFFNLIGYKLVKRIVKKPFQWISKGML